MNIFDVDANLRQKEQMKLTIVDELRWRMGHCHSFAEVNIWKGIINFVHEEFDRLPKDVERY